MWFNIQVEATDKLHFWGSLLRLALLNTFVRDMACWTEPTINKFVDNTKLHSAVKNLEGIDSNGRDFDRFERLPCANLTNFKDKRSYTSVRAISSPNQAVRRID